MDLDTLRYATTVMSFFVFAGIVVWAMSSRNKPAFDEAQQLPFQETEDSE